MNQGGLGIYPTSQPSLTGRIGPAPAGRGWDQPNNFNGPAMAGQGYAQAGNAGGYGVASPCPRPATGTSPTTSTEATRRSSVFDSLRSVCSHTALPAFAHRTKFI
jgi:hypothetical protein